MKPLLLFTGPVATRSGYGAHCRDLVKSLMDMDKFDIHINSLRWGSTPMNALSPNDPDHKKILDKFLNTPNLSRQPDIHIQVSVPNEFTPMAKYNIGITAGIENTAPKPEWIEGMNKMNMNIVPSKFVKNIFESVTYERMDENKKKVGELKSTTPINVLFEGADTDVYKLTKEFSTDLISELDKIKEKWCFLYVGHWLQGELGQDRKDTGMLVKTFLETFKNKKQQPALILKTSSATFSVIDRNEILEKVQMIRDGVKATKYPKIYVLHGDLLDEEMNGLYNHPKVKAHITFTHGEGYGRPLLEATLSEKPVIASDWSGHLDFLNKHQSVLLPGALTNVHKSALPKEMRVDGAKWFTVNYQYAAQIMRDMFKNYRKYSFNAKKMGKINKSKFSLNSMTKQFESILNEYLPKFEEQPQSVNLKLPKLKKVGDSAPKTIKLPKLKKV
tara:strand:- start:3604 stop:4938 length:1335 start_codon:yes stop_codon:yes gene_type:complete